MCSIRPPLTAEVRCGKEERIHDSDTRRDSSRIQKSTIERRYSWPTTSERRKGVVVCAPIPDNRHAWKRLCLRHPGSRLVNGQPAIHGFLQEPGFTRWHAPAPPANSTLAPRVLRRLKGARVPDPAGPTIAGLLAAIHSDPISEASCRSYRDHTECLAQSDRSTGESFDPAFGPAPVSMSAKPNRDRRRLGQQLAFQTTS
jgi:hypothetical protein